MSRHDADTRRLCALLGIDGKYCGTLIEAGITTRTLASFSSHVFAHVLESLDIPTEIVGQLWGAIDGMREGKEGKEGKRGEEGNGRGGRERREEEGREGREGRDAKRAAPPAPRLGTDTGKRRKAAASPKVEVAARDRPVCRLCTHTCSVHRRHPDTGDIVSWRCKLCGWQGLKSQAENCSWTSGRNPSTTSGEIGSKS